MNYALLSALLGALLGHPRIKRFIWPKSALPSGGGGRKKTGRKILVTNPLSFAHPGKIRRSGETLTPIYTILLKYRRLLRGQIIAPIGAYIGVRVSPERRILFPVARGRGGPSPGNSVPFFFVRRLSSSRNVCS